MHKPSKLWVEAMFSYTSYIKRYNHNVSLTLEEWSRLRLSPCSICGEYTDNSIIKVIDKEQVISIDNVKPMCNRCSTLYNNHKLKDKK